MKNFITDMGRETEVIDVETKEVVMVLKRYAVWTHDDSKNKHQVKETSNDLAYLVSKYDVDENHIVKTSTKK